MSSELYFFDQDSRGSHIGSFYRSKRNLKDFDQAFYHVRVALSLDSDQPDGEGDSNISFPTIKHANGIPSETILLQMNTPIIPEILTKELDTVLKKFNEESKTASPTSERSKSPVEGQEESSETKSNLPKVSLPAQLILQLHSTWIDLIKNTNYKHKVWRTKAGEDAWRHYVRQKRTQQLNSEKHQDTSDDKHIVRRRASSRVSVSSVSSLSHRHSITSNPKMRLSRSFSRASFMSTSSNFQENLRLLKSIHQGTSEHIVEPIKNGIHVEFKFSSQDEQKKQKIALFELPQRNLSFNEDIIAFTQNKCKRLLAETRQKIRETTQDQDKKWTNIRKFWFYEDNQYTRNKNDFLASYESNRRQKSKFALAILRHEIPEKFHIDINTPETKHKCYIELTDGSTQIYYPSGRLAVLRLRSPISTTLFFDDTDSVPHKFLGLITSTGSVLLMQPTFHARFITNNQYDNGYLCNGKTGIIEKQFQWYSSKNYQRLSLILSEDSSINPLENTIQLQINPFMQLEYHNSSNILFAFTCQDEEFKLQLGAPPPIPSTTLKNLAATILAAKRMSGERNSLISTIRSNSLSSNEEKQLIKIRKISDEQTRSHQLPIMQELTSLRKRIKQICHSWLEECRTTLGIMNIDAYHLPDLPLQSAVIETKPQIDDKSCSKSAKQYHSPTSTKNKLIQSFNRQPFLRADQFESNIIANAIEQFVPYSDTGRSIKQRIYAKKILPATLPVIK